MIGHIGNIWRKELMDTIRDKKAFRQALLIPLLIGVVYAALNPFILSFVESKSRGPVTIAVQGLSHADDVLPVVLEEFGITLAPYEGDLETAIASGIETAGLILSAGFSDNVAGERLAGLKLLVNPAVGGPFGGSTFSVERLQAALRTYGQLISGRRLEARGLDPALLTPIQLEVQDLSTSAQKAGVFASFMLPILVGLLVVQGGLFIAIDVTAGEKERHTLEALLVTPSSDSEIFLGKLAAVFTMSTIPLVLTLFGYWATSNLLPESMTHGAVLPFTVIVQTILLTLPLALFVNVLLMILSIRTRTFKDAQSAVVPLNLVVVFTAMSGAFFPPPSEVFHLIPVYGTTALVSQLAVGAALSPTAVLLSVIGGLGGATIGVFFALKLFNRERLLYSA